MFRSHSLPFMIFMMIMIMDFLRVPFALWSDTLMMTSIIAIWIRIFSFTMSVRLLIRGHIYVWRMLKYIQKLWINIYFEYGNVYRNISSLICWLFHKKNTNNFLTLIHISKFSNLTYNIMLMLSKSLLSTT